MREVLRNPLRHARYAASGPREGRRKGRPVPEKLLGQQMPRRVRVVAIEAEDWTTFGEELTPAVAAAVPAAVAEVRRLVEQATA